MMDPNSVQVQHLQLLQQQRQAPGFAGYAPAFVAPPLSGMQSDYQYAGMQYGMQYPLQHAEKQQIAAAAPEAAPKADVEAPPAKVSRASKKASEKNGTTYASRHQAAESRRRQRINDRCGTHALECALSRACLRATARPRPTRGQASRALRQCTCVKSARLPI